MVKQNYPKDYSIKLFILLLQGLVITFKRLTSLIWHFNFSITLADATGRLDCLCSEILWFGWTALTISKVHDSQGVIPLGQNNVQSIWCWGKQFVNSELNVKNLNIYQRGFLELTCAIVPSSKTSCYIYILRWVGCFMGFLVLLSMLFFDKAIQGWDYYYFGQIYVCWNAITFKFSFPNLIWSWSVLVFFRQ